MADNTSHSLPELLQGLTQPHLAPLDFLGKGSLAERILSLVLGETLPPGIPGCSREWRQLADGLRGVDVSDLCVVVLGGGTGLSRVVGGDSRRPEWKDAPFTGLKEVFPQLHSIVCVTDDGGSTGELLKDFPLIGFGDLRRVLLASVRSSNLKKQYQLDDSGALTTAAALHSLFNCRFTVQPESAEQLWEMSGTAPELLPAPLAGYLADLIKRLLHDTRLKTALGRPQCLGNLLIAAAVHIRLPSFFRTAELIANQKRLQAATLEGVADLSVAIGAGRNAVLPCTVTSAQLQVLYANGVFVTGEAKADSAERGWPVKRVRVRFADEPVLPEEAAALLRRADIILFAPGSLYTSIIPILQVPGLAELIRSNSKALKLLTANLWVQQGETDATLDAPERKFYVSDLIQAYDGNIPGGIQDLFSHVLALDLADIPGSVLQNYAIERKEPIYMDSEQVRSLGLEPVQARIFARDLLRQEQIIQHDSDSLALAVRTLWGLRASGFLPVPPPVLSERKPPKAAQLCLSPNRFLPCIRHDAVRQIISGLDFRQVLRPDELPAEMEPERRERLAAAVTDIIWRHHDIHPDHLCCLKGLCLVSSACWQRGQQWDNIFSFYDPADGWIKMREDQADDPVRLEMPLLIALGQSLLGNYCAEKHIEPILFQEQQVGRIYWLTLREPQNMTCFLSAEQLDAYLQISRMRPVKPKRVYARTINGGEGFVPPGLLFGVFFAWYLDCRLAPNVEYMMTIMKSGPSDLVAKQAETVRRQEKLINFFREDVFRAKIS
jgi:uncharacterized cofD-like protein